MHSNESYLQFVTLRKIMIYISKVLFVLLLFYCPRVHGKEYTVCDFSLSNYIYLIKNDIYNSSATHAQPFSG